jgi:manganese transport protein
VILKLFKNIGPGSLVTAAFIGPGTVTVCLLSGNQFGFSLLWVLIFSTLSTILLQEMSARLGIISGKGLGEALRHQISHPIAKKLMIVLVFSAIFIGNTAYEAGNISGARMGIELMLKTENLNPALINCFMGAIVAVILFFGNYAVLERFFILVVLLMSTAFIVTAMVTKPNISELIKGLLIPGIPEKSWFTIIGLIGTTIVPYNLFLHAYLVSKKWSDAASLPRVRKDLIYAIVLGGLISMSIVISGAAIGKAGADSFNELASGLEPLFGSYASAFFGIGLFAAGITSTITAPLAAAIAVRGVMGWDDDHTNIRYRLVWMIVLGAGITFASIGYKPLIIIRFAQFANGLLLPLIAGFLIWIVNSHAIMGKYANQKMHNIAGGIVMLISIGLGIKSVISVF